MSMNIKDEEAHHLARELASLTGQSLTEAVKTALQHELKRAKVVRIRKGRPLVERLNDIALRCGNLPDLGLTLFVSNPIMRRAISASPSGL